MTFMRHSFVAIISSVTLLLWSACASYKLGTHGTLPFESIYIVPAKNESFAPQAQALVSAQVREAFIKDGRVKVLSSIESADVVLELTLSDYDRNVGARLRADTVAARTVNLGLTASVSLFEAENGVPVFELRQISQTTTVHSDNPYAGSTRQQQSYIQAEHNAMERLARGIARKITDEVLSPWPTHKEASATQAAKEAVDIQATTAVTETVTE